MMKKIYILGLIVSFLFSTTGFSITQHICKMMEEVSSEQCGMCTENEIPETLPCCEDENYAGEIITSGNFSECCNTQVVENKVEDQFLYFKEELKNNLTSSVIELPLSVLINDKQIVKSHSLYAFDSSPPLHGNHLYIFNSVLII
jgi:hypothetical protein